MQIAFPRRKYVTDTNTHGQVHKVLITDAIIECEEHVIRLKYTTMPKMIFV
jgi:hypothetical protein